MKTKEYSVYGTWEVSTEGDVEGRSMRRLGIYTGYLDEIAFALANQCTYTLHFKKYEPQELDMTPKKTMVQISLDYDAPVFRMNVVEAKAYYENFFKGRNVDVRACHGYGSCTIACERMTKEEKREALLKKLKLSEEEKELLGIK